MIDTHCHLTDARLLSQLGAVLLRAAQAGVSRIITIGTDLDDAQAAITLCGQKTGLRSGVGIHPNHSHEADVSHIPRLKAMCQESSVVAVGEMGLDYFHHFADRAHQATMFSAQLDLAVAIGKPVVIHCREAVDDALAILRGFAGVRGVFHCFTGTADEARRILDAGFMIGFTGPVTYKRNDELRSVVRLVPADRLLLETDAPYLSPEPVRSSKVNEPALVMHTARRVAQERGISLDELDALSTQNTRSLFGLWDDLLTPAK
jgi:TatD DNase family protein